MATEATERTIERAASGEPTTTGWRRSRFSAWVYLAVVAAALLPVLTHFTGWISNYSYLQLSLVLVFSIAVLGLNLLTGFNGQISLGHGAFFGIGAYTAGILLDQTGVPYWATIPVAALVCFSIGYLFGFPALRLEGHYLALATLALAIAMPQILKYRHLEGLTGGVQGLNLIKPDAPFGLPLSPDQWMYLVVLAVAVVMFWLARNLLDSRMGRAMMAIRDYSMAAQTMGINNARVKMTTFGISALYTGVAGALHAIIFEFIAPDSFRLELSISLLVGAVVGGIASLPGALLGGAFVQLIEKYADAATRFVSHNVNLPIELEPWTLYGIMLIVLMFVMPTGIAGGLAALARRFGLGAKGGADGR
ncbi:MAG: branched-chain amino acid ABC transporter permease [Hyphomicrobiaceae bacterium]